jgi:bacterioferritin
MFCLGVADNSLFQTVVGAPNCTIGGCASSASCHPQKEKEGKTMSAKASVNSKEKDQKTFLSDITEIRRRARQHIEEGAVTDTYKGDRNVVLRVLNEALATEIVCVLRYKRHHYMAKGIHSQAVAEEFLEHAAEEQEHADMIAERITQLDGEPNFNPEGLLTRSHSEYVAGESLVEMIREDLIAERIAIESYSEIVRYLADNDPTSRRLMESILAKEEEHAEDMKTLLETVAQEEKLEDRRKAS